MGESHQDDYIVVVGKYEGTIAPERRGVCGKIILKCIFNMLSGKLSIGPGD
jgi:hypothetical protein